MVLPIGAIVILLLVFATAYFGFRLMKPQAVRAELCQDGFQEARISIDRGYIPAAVEVTAGVPVRLRFWRKEDDPCSERIVFSEIGMDRRIPAFEETSIEFIPRAPGEILFTCQWGLYRGKVVITEPKRRKVRK